MARKGILSRFFGDKAESLTNVETGSHEKEEIVDTNQALAHISGRTRQLNKLESWINVYRGRLVQELEYKSLEKRKVERREHEAVDHFEKLDECKNSHLGNIAQSYIRRQNQGSRRPTPMERFLLKRIEFQSQNTGATVHYYDGTLNKESVLFPEEIAASDVLRDISISLGDDVLIAYKKDREPLLDSTNDRILKQVLIPIAEELEDKIFSAEQEIKKITDELETVKDGTHEAVIRYRELEERAYQHEYDSAFEDSMNFLQEISSDLALNKSKQQSYEKKVSAYGTEEVIRRAVSGLSGLRSFLSEVDFDGIRDPDAPVRIDDDTNRLILPRGSVERSSGIMARHPKKSYMASNYQDGYIGKDRYSETTYKDESTGLELTITRVSNYMGEEVNDFRFSYDNVILVAGSFEANRETGKVEMNSVSLHRTLSSDPEYRADESQEYKDKYDSIAKEFAAAIACPMAEDMQAARIEAIKTVKNSPYLALKAEAAEAAARAEEEEVMARSERLDALLGGMNTP